MGFKIKAFKIYSPHAYPIRDYIPTLDRIITDTMKKGMINVIPIEGRGQSGKSTFADWKTKQYDPNYFLMYTIEDLFKMIDGWTKLLDVEIIKDNGFDKAIMKKPENMSKIMYKWIFWDEPQAEVNNIKFWDERIYIASQLTSTWGFLKQQLILATIDVGSLPSFFMRNVSCKIVMKVFLRNQEREYRYFIHVPRKHPKTGKWYWGYPIGYGIMPTVELPVEYWERKLNNFFNVQLEKLKDNLIIDKRKREWFTKKKDKPLEKNEVLALFKDGRVEYKYAFNQLRANGLSEDNSILLLDSAGSVGSDY